VTAIAHVVCDRVAAGGQPAGSVAVDCRGCGVPVWFDLTDADLVDVDEVHPYCTACAPDDIPIGITPAQLARLRGAGATDMDIAHVLAICTLSNGNAAAVAGVQSEINRDPHGPTAGRYRELKADAFIAVIAVIGDRP
jgi:hypothetical protein